LYRRILTKKVATDSYSITVICAAFKSGDMGSNPIENPYKEKFLDKPITRCRMVEVIGITKDKFSRKRPATGTILI
jgi:hypothetical protein